MALTDSTRAAVFARDKGICAFSGLSVWILDYGTAPFWHPDWVDHIYPKSRGGSDNVDNLVCATHFYNRKKLNNTSDREYLFHSGQPTETFYWRHGELSAEQARLLNSHACLTISDWYFNRALFNIMVAVVDEYDGFKAVRDRSYWLGAAGKRLERWRSLSRETERDFIKRRLVRYPSARDVQLMLELRHADERRLVHIYAALLSHYRANVAALENFLKAPNRVKRHKVIRAAKAGLATLPLLSVLHINNALIPAEQTCLRAKPGRDGKQRPR